jgi:hypothetical protein
MMVALGDFRDLMGVRVAEERAGPAMRSMKIKGRMVEAA